MPDAAHSPAFDEVLQQYLSRRGFLGRTLAAGSAFLLGRAASAASSRATGLTFEPVPARIDDALHVPPGYEWKTVLAWGDPMHSGVGPFAAGEQTAASQAQRFGFNCDFVGFLRMASERGILVVNHDPHGSEMFAGYAPERPAPAHVEVEMQAVGLSVVEVVREKSGAWVPVLDSRLNRRITGTTEVALSGPAAGHALLRTAADPSGRCVAGTLNNCSGGVTPWGTVLSGEENVQDFFGCSEAENPRRSLYGWETHPGNARFDEARHRNEPNRFGWVVEVDPLDPESRPVKRTALGHFKHEAAACGLADDRRVVVYSGDDERLQFVYKFISDRRYDPERPRADLNLLDRGTLHVARFEPDGSGRWLPLVPEGPLAGKSQAEILIDTRGSARALGATPMDRPEDVQVNPVNRRVYLTLTKDADRVAEDAGAHANPRPGNRHGHVLELDESGGDLGATEFTWSIFLLCGPAGASGVQYGPWSADDVDPLSCPDNLAFDGHGRLWIATDGQPLAQGTNDALFAVATAGPQRQRPRRFLTGPIGCEICGPEFTPDGRTLFVSIQHPGEGSGIGQPASSRWPDGGDGPPRPAVVAIWRTDGGVIGS